eukprot:CAMPEP_0115000214 /NCGR_PEP_ID=MMETSP0216-20121206/16624_1 /TAXON_ID=223996 /ORGANISM="Protocruzia adherens, Strain Boccale" /LENGTH=220 /DNA_ID=CAMNT_0002365269 /DNA_START=270 /DNA_END=929 /DNA_ORIENTATION=-
MRSHQILSLYKSLGNTMFDFLRTIRTKPGGLYGVFRKEFTEMWFDRHIYKHSIPELCFKGVCGCLLDLGSRFQGQKLLVFNTHTDHVNVKHGQEIQLSEVQAFMGRSLTQIKLKYEDFDFNKCTVLVMGDFNIDITNYTLYAQMLKKLNARDLYFEYCTREGGRPEATLDVGNSYNLFTQARVDYVFGIDSYDDVDFAPAKVSKAEVIKQKYQEELSDHW